MPRPLIHVACGVLVQPDGRLLIAQRPEGKIAAGKWEFPGGKIEPGETGLDALRRELHEELGISVTAAEPLLRFCHDYSDRSVVLDTWRVTAWDGALQSREQQAFAWQTPAEAAALDTLPTVRPILRVLGLPAQYVFTPPTMSPQQLAARLRTLPPGALLRLRLPALADADYAEAAQRLLPLCRQAGLRLLLDRSPALVEGLGAAGWHARASALRAHATRPLAERYLIAASVHDAEELDLAERLGANLAVLAPVLPTATHPGQPGLGWPAFAALRAQRPLAVFALGGVGPEDLPEALARGAQGVAGISAWWSPRGVAQ